MLKSFLAVFFFVAAVIAQNVEITLPKYNQTVTPGQHIIVQVTRPDSLTGSEDVSVAIGLQSCPDRPCFPPSDLMGEILFNGLYRPKFHERFLQPYQNYSVLIPKTTPAGTASIGVAHTTLIGAGLFPFLDVLNQTIFIK